MPTLWVTAGGLSQGSGIAAPIALAAAGLAWLVLAAVRVGPLTLAAVAVMGTAGGEITGTDTYGLIFVGVAAGGAAFSSRLPVAAALAAASPAAFTLATIPRGVSLGRLPEVAVVCLAGTLSGVGRREIILRDQQAAVVAAAGQRAEEARREAELVAERNRLGREMHDVLGHTLGALSIQLTALDTLTRTGTGREELLTQIERGHQLVAEGLDEARQAVRALREDIMPLAAPIGRLCELHGAGLEVSGTPRQVRAEASLPLYRVVQEALTNAASAVLGTHR